MLVNLLKLHFGWHLARIKCLAYIIVALFKIKTVTLTEVATAFPGTAEIESHYKRLQRFFKQVEIKSSLIATFVVAFLPYETYTLSMDRTNWMLGCFPINFLVGSSPRLRPSAKARHTRRGYVFAYCVHFATRTPSFGSA